MSTKTDYKAADEIWGREITNPKQKQQAAEKLAMRLKKGDVVGIGSGSTSFMTIKVLASRRDNEGLDFWAIPSSLEMERICAALAIPTTTLIAKSPNWSFDGADEVDDNGNMIKGRGGAMLCEKMLIKASPEVYVVIDRSKRVKKLGQNFPVPIEIHPESLQIVTTALEILPEITKIVPRQAVAKDGLVITEKGNLILDVTFSKITTNMETKLKSMVGVVETGLFIGYKPKIILAD